MTQIPRYLRRAPDARPSSILGILGALGPGRDGRDGPAAGGAPGVSDRAHGPSSEPGARPAGGPSASARVGDPGRG